MTRFSQRLCINRKNIIPKRNPTSKNSIFKQVKIWTALVRQRKDLAKLDERMLADIGYTVEQAKVEASKPFWK